MKKEKQQILTIVKILGLGLGKMDQNSYFLILRLNGDTP